MISTGEWGRHGGLPLQERRFVGATPCGCPLACSIAHVGNPLHRHLPSTSALVFRHARLPPLRGVGFLRACCSWRCRAGHFCFHASETLALPAHATRGTRASRPQKRPREKKTYPFKHPLPPSRGERLRWWLIYQRAGVRGDSIRELWLRSWYKMSHVLKS